MDQKRENKTSGSGEPAASVYSDAYYRAAPEEKRACYGYSPAQCYAHTADQETPQASGKKRGFPFTGAAAALILAIVLLTFSLFFSGSMLLNRQASAAEDASDSSRMLYEQYSVIEDAAGEDRLSIRHNSIDAGVPLSAEEIYTAACRSTVGVTIPGYAFNIFGQPGATAVTGTGIVLSEDGYILTNYHVIETARADDTSILILTYEGDQYEAEVIGVEPDSDLAVLKIDAQDLTPAVLGDSDEMRVGQTIYTVGNPLGELTYTMTSGIISALGRRITTDAATIVNMFQVDAAINNGNSGGPVFNVCGQVIGVVTAKYSQYGMEGLGFAIPINDACSIAADLVEKGYVTGKAYLGMSFANVTPSVARYYDMVQGVYICSVEENSCSEAAGLLAGDIIIGVDGSPVNTTDQLLKAVREYRAGDSVDITVWRLGRMFTVTVILDEETPSDAGPALETPAPAGPHPSNEPDFVRR